MYAVVDIGSNTIRLSVYKLENNTIKQMFYKKKVAGLAGYVDSSQCLSERGIKRVINVLNSFKLIFNNIELKDIFVFATASLRNISNTKDAVEQIKNSCGFDVRILSGEEEAYLDYVGAMQNVSLPSGLLVDIGGGSTELVFYKDKEILKALSMPIGSLNMYSKYVSALIPNSAELKQIQQVTLAELDKLKIPRNFLNTGTACGVGGTARASCKMNNDILELPVNNREIDCADLKKTFGILKNNGRETLMRILQIVPDRIHTIVPGMLILKMIVKYYHCEKIVISECGVREGYLSELLRSRGEISSAGTSSKVSIYTK